MPQKQCQWELDVVDEIWSSSCKEPFRFNVGDPYDNHFTYCPFCGKTITIVYPND